MGRIQHLAIAAIDPYKQADFYKKVFGWEEVHRLDNPRCFGVVLTDGALNISVLNFKQDQLGHGLEFTGLHHFGVYVEDLEGTAEMCEEEGCEHFSDLPEDPEEKKNYYRTKRSDKFSGPENALFDIAAEPWIGVAKEAAE
jgi:catechol 2,3-dioxygenase-like lactoylglutathione lyase family enzyme